MIFYKDEGERKREKEFEREKNVEKISFQEFVEHKTRVCKFYNDDFCEMITIDE